MEGDEEKVERREEPHVVRIDRASICRPHELELFAAYFHGRGMQEGFKRAARAVAQFAKVLEKTMPRTPRRVMNETQIRDARTGNFLRRIDDGDVTKSVSASALFHEALAKARARRRPKR